MTVATPPDSAIGLVPEFSYRADLKPPLPFGDGPRGTRVFFEVTGGSFSGERLRGTLTGGGGDWLLMGADGFGRLDVRAQMVTDDGAAIYVRYEGLLEINDTVQAALAEGGGTALGDQYFRTTPYLETGDERYDWVNRSLFLGEGHLYPGGVEYFVSRVV